MPMTPAATLTSIAETNQWWENAAMECVICANNGCSAFSYLHEVMTRYSERDTYGWPDDKEHQMLHANGDGSDFDINIEEADAAAAVAHAIIGKEVPIVKIQAFHDTLLSRGASATMTENVGMLAELASVVFGSIGKSIVPKLMPGFKRSNSIMH
eukprot:760768-Ditylum_brightwellii.AAC.2